MNPYKRIGGLDKTVKPLIIRWFADLFKYENYPHSHADQWISWNVWDGHLTVGFDFRQEEHVKLFSLIHPRFKGVPQYQTLKIVNENSFYLDLKQLLQLKYPNIISSKLINKVKHKDNDGDIFYTYDWEVFLDDDTSIMYHNQKEKMDIVKGNFIYNSIIQERSFVNFLKEKYESQSLAKSV
jgi:hypothetical protein